MALDVTDPASIKAASAELNGQAIDVIINNAGVMGARGHGNIDYKAWANVLDVNTMGPMRISEAFVDHVARSKRKLIVALTSPRLMGEAAHLGGRVANSLSRVPVRNALLTGYQTRGAGQ